MGLTCYIVALVYFITAGADGPGATPPLRHAAGRFRFGVQRAPCCGWIASCYPICPPCRFVAVEAVPAMIITGNSSLPTHPLESKSWTDSLSAQHFTRTWIAIPRPSRTPTWPSATLRGAIANTI